MQEIEHRINSDISSEEPEADQPSSKFTFAKAITGGRNKISWDNKHRTWKLNIKPPETVTKYLEEKKLTLTVPLGLSKAAFDNERRETFRRAVNVWNELYKNNGVVHFKIRLPEKFEKETITIPHQEGCQRRPHDSDSEDEEESDDDIALGP